MHFHFRTATDSAEELGKAIPGAGFQLVADSGASFAGRYRHLFLDGIVLSHLDLDQATILTVNERKPDFDIWHAIGGPCSANGEAVRDNEVTVVRSGEGASMRSAGPARAQSFGLQPWLRDEAPELDLPFGRAMAPTAGRWRVGSVDARLRFMAQHQAILDQIDQQAGLLETAATRTTLRNAILETVLQLGEAGDFQADRAAVGRHTRIMMRFEEIVEEVSDAPLGMAEICRRTATSRRSLEAVVRLRTGKSPWEYLRWRRLWRAQAMLSRPEPETTVTGVAFALGFWHLSRFAAAYARTFGERPSVTLVRGAGAGRSFAQIG
jgi:AraC-like DNA-binding protein